MICPNWVKKLPVSTTIKPVTQTALVDVNIASINVIPECVALGRANNIPPITIKMKKLKINNWAGLKIALLKFILMADSSRIKTRIIAKYSQYGCLSILSDWKK